MRAADLITGPILAVVGLVLALWVIPIESVPGDEGEIAPAFMPTAVVTVIVVLAILQTIVAGFAGKRSVPAIDRFSALFVVASAVLLTLALAATAALGFVIGGTATIIFIGFLMRPTGAARGWLIAVAVAFPLGSYYLVWYGLRLALP
ncbi:MAG: tripartite tricarboxylate transporter TctB family protein [Alphaproteobacteria bacterium]|jgi:hypothetical protein|nr:hypothetical protein [Rhodospirillaceae bacterium]MDP6406830.1 tripartite tricarboxylate transporter TctB family protein [Alphaproteobacteria bacterium]MDP6621666.1 tripartite tricarboxylate transporter TctB family protein [Alphaproteobacteria bacterium]|tara:strand:+ start:3909 stop:4352 length:444 start_codon:yes stop_codon:yes gene_type:complete